MKVEIKNFQSIENLSLDLKSGLTVITGRSNIGKSSILRAISFLMTNKYNKSFLRDGSKELYISIDGVERVKSSKVNRYVIDGKIYDKVATNVPEHLSEIGMSVFEYEGGSDNTMVVPQYKPMFLVNESMYGQTAIFNSIFKVSVYERAISLMNRDIQKKRRELSKEDRDLSDMGERKSELEHKVSDIKRLIRLMDIKSDIISLHSEIDDIERMRNKISYLCDYMKSLLSLEHIKSVYDHNRTEDMFSFLRKFSIAISTLMNLSELKRSKEIYTDNIFDRDRYLSMLMDVDRLTSLADRLDMLYLISRIYDDRRKLRDLSSLFKLIKLTMLLFAIRNVVVMNIKASHLARLLSSIDKYVSINDLSDAILRTRDYDSELKQISSGVCPCCGSKINYMEVE